MLVLLFQSGDAGSHWDADVLFGSIMTPTIGLAPVTRLDMMTLAVFEDTGWYRVNFNEAEDLVWGRGL